MTRWVLGALVLISASVMLGCGGGGGLGGVGGGLDDEMFPDAAAYFSKMVVFVFSDLGMHCMNEDFSELMILPPGNTLRAVLVDRSQAKPRIVTGGSPRMRFRVLDNTTSASKTNFWEFAEAIFKRPIAPDTGLTGTGLEDRMMPTEAGYWEATGIPVTPTDDRGRFRPYPYAQATVWDQNVVVARAKNVLPVSWEMNCGRCHRGETTWADDVLADHDRLHATSTRDHKPVACGRCHPSASTAAVGGLMRAGLPSLSRAMHSTHAGRMGRVTTEPVCYTCHPGPVTQCQRDVHSARGMDCLDCHGDMSAVADAGREPWVDVPRCESCHAGRREGFQFEQAGVPYRESVGHKKIPCAACHGAPHAITPSTRIRDNRMAVELQGHEGPIDDCSLCHSRSMAGKDFPHRR